MSKPNNPISMRPSPKLREAVEAADGGLTRYVNELFDRVQLMVALDAIRLTEQEQAVLKSHLQGVPMDDIAIQSIPQDIAEEECDSLTEKLQNATFGQVWATLKKYNLL